MQTVTLRLPSAWSSYLFYGDVANLTKGELMKIYNFLKEMDLDFTVPLSTEDYGFAKWHDATNFGVLPADCSEYTFPINEFSSPFWRE
jgi:hypothetical protein